MFFSVIIPTYNRGIQLVNAVDRVLQQDFQDFEIVIIDDGSVDNTKEIISTNFNDQRICYYYQNNTGVCSARNKGVELSSGKYITFLDSDDEVATDWLNSFFQEINKTSPDIVFCDINTIHPQTKEIKTVQAQYPYRKNIKTDYGLYLAGAFCIKRDMMLQTNGFDTYLRFGEFTEWSFRLNKLQPKKSFTKKVSFTYNVSISGGGKNNQNKIDANIYIIQKHPDYFKKNSEVLRYYFQNIAVAYAKLNQLSNARIYFWRAYKLNLLKIKTLARMIICFFPNVADRIWKR